MKMKKLIFLSLTLGLTFPGAHLFAGGWMSRERQEDKERVVTNAADNQENNNNASQESDSLFDKLPDELVCEIFEYLLAEYLNLTNADPSSIDSAAKQISENRRISTRFNDIINDKILIDKFLKENVKLTSVQKLNILEKLAKLRSKQIPEILKSQLQELVASTQDLSEIYKILSTFLKNPNLFNRVKKQLILYIDDFAKKRHLPNDWVQKLDSKMLLELGLIKLCCEVLISKIRITSDKYPKTTKGVVSAIGVTTVGGVAWTLELPISTILCWAFFGIPGAIIKYFF